MLAPASGHQVAYCDARRTLQMAGESLSEGQMDLLEGQVAHPRASWTIRRLKWPLMGCHHIHDPGDWKPRLLDGIQYCPSKEEAE